MNGDPLKTVVPETKFGYDKWVVDIQVIAVDRSEQTTRVKHMSKDVDDK